MLLSFLLEFAYLPSKGLQVILETRICLLYLYLVLHDEAVKNECGIRRTLV